MVLFIGEAKGGIYKRVPVTLGEQIELAYEEMISNWNEARRQASIATKIPTEFPSDARSQRIMVPQDPNYQDAVGAQAMYDRWATRDATILGALIDFAFLISDPDMTTMLDGGNNE
jgi:hypothetical protein